MNRDEMVSIAEKYITGLGAGDFSQVPFSTDITYVVWNRGHQIRSPTDALKTSTALSKLKHLRKLGIGYTTISLRVLFSALERFWRIRSGQIKNKPKRPE